MSYSKIQKNAIIQATKRACAFASLYKNNVRTFYELSLIRGSGDDKRHSSSFVSSYGLSNLKLPDDLVSVLITKLSDRQVSDMVEYCKKYCIL